MAQKIYTFEDSTFRYEVIEDDSLFNGKHYRNGNDSNGYSYKYKKFGFVNVYSKSTQELYQTLIVKQNEHDSLKKEILRIQDINFDGYNDIGLLISNGDFHIFYNQYHYWLFDTITKRFISTEVFDTLDISNINQKEKKIHCKTEWTNCIYPASNRIYQYEGTRLNLIYELRVVTSYPVGACRKKWRLYYSKRRHKLMLLHYDSGECGRVFIYKLKNGQVKMVSNKYKSNVTIGPCF